MPTQAEKNQALDAAARARTACARAADRQMATVGAAEATLATATAALAALITAGAALDPARAGEVVTATNAKLDAAAELAAAKPLLTAAQRAHSDATAAEAAAEALVVT